MRRAGTFQDSEQEGEGECLGSVPTEGPAWIRSGPPMRLPAQSGHCPASRERVEPEGLLRCQSLGLQTPKTGAQTDPVRPRSGQMPIT